MKIKYAVMGSDMNPFYYDFWPIVSKVWRDKFNITPVLGLISDDTDIGMIKDENGIVFKFRRIEGIDVGLQSQLIRVFISTLLDDVVILTDVDMLPLSNAYFVEQFQDLDDDKLYVMTSDNYECERNKEIPMCYNVAHSNTFRQVFRDIDNWKDFLVNLSMKNLGWTTDQRYLYEMINDYANIATHKVVKLNRGWTPLADRRIDRIAWGYNKELVSNGYYIDAHLPRPYKDHKGEIDNLISLL